MESELSCLRKMGRHLLCNYAVGMPDELRGSREGEGDRSKYGSSISR
jgi:hypothetical protein